MKLYLVRHGLTDACLPGYDKSTKNISLNEEGKRQIAALSIPCITRILASPTLRTQETAHQILVQSSVPLQVETEIRLWNKVSHEDLYEKNIRSLLLDLSDLESVVVLVTHGRIIKMIRSLLFYNRLNRDYMDQIELEYGHLECHFI